MSSLPSNIISHMGCRFVLFVAAQSQLRLKSFGKLQSDALETGIEHARDAGSQGALHIFVIR